MLVLRFETDPGPRDNRQLRFRTCGATARSCSRGSTPDRDLTRLPLPLHSPPSSPSRVKVSSRPSRFRSSYRWEQVGDQVSSATRGTMEPWSTAGNGRAPDRWMLPDGSLRQDHPDGTQERVKAVSVPLANSAQVVWSSPATALDSRWDTTSADPVLVRTFKVGDVTTTVRVRGSLVGKSLVLEIEADRPVARLLDAGIWGPVMRPQNRPGSLFFGSGRLFPCPGPVCRQRLRLDLIGGDEPGWLACRVYAVDRRQEQLAPRAGCLHGRLEPRRSLAEHPESTFAVFQTSGGSCSTSGADDTPTSHGTSKSCPSTGSTLCRDHSRLAA